MNEMHGVRSCGFPGGTSGKEPACHCRRHKRCWFDPWVGKILGGRHGNPLQYFRLENPMDRDWRATVHRVTQSQTQLKRLSMQKELQTSYKIFHIRCIKSPITGNENPLI